MEGHVEYHDYPEHSEAFEEAEGFGRWVEDPLSAFMPNEQTGIIEPVQGRRVA